MRHRRRTAAEVAPTVLFVVNDPIATEAMLGSVFRDRGFGVAAMEVVPAGRVDDPCVTVSFPDPQRYDAIAVLGARWAVYDDELQRNWISQEVRFVRDADAAGIPVLGICFGGQLLAHAFGGSVTRSTAPEIGWFPVESDRDDVVPGGQWFQWHFDRWALPPGATEIARNGNASQAFALRRMLAVQFHPELDSSLLALWLDHDRDEVIEAGIDPNELLCRTAELEKDSASRLGALVDGFLASATPGAQPGA